MKYSISVVLACYNGERYLSAQLNSIRAQCMCPSEVIVSDDCSCDATLEVAENFSRSCSFFVSVLKGGENLGYSMNFNRALQICSGDFVFLCDQDDVWLPNKLERMLEIFTSRPDIVLAIHDLEFCDENLSPIGQTKIERMSAGQDIQQDYVVGMATAIRGDFLRLCLPIPDLPGVTHDRWLHDCALAVNGKLVVKEVLALYRRHGQNAAADRAVNAGFVTNKWTFLWERFKEPSRLKMQVYIPDSPLAEWLSRQREALIGGGYIDEARLESLIVGEILRVDVLRERHRLLQLPRWRRLSSIIRLLLSGGYMRFFSWKSAVKDLIKP